jgi:SAM-dependent methyltransferase
VNVRARGGEAARRWREASASRAIPEAILGTAPVSPWGFPPEVFRARARDATASEPSVSDRRALEALPEGGTVLDVGCGAGAGSIVLAGRASLVTGVDPSPDLLASFVEGLASRTARVEAVEGTWPEVAADVPVHDVAVCHHVVYNVAEIVGFLDALTDHARSRVVVELTHEHPLAWMDDLWRTLHGFAMPPGPTADDLVSVLTALGIEVEREEHERSSHGGLPARDDAIALVRRRLCLPPERDEDVARALGDRLVERDGRWSAGPQQQRLVTLWWRGNGR